MKYLLYLLLGASTAAAIGTTLMMIASAISLDIANAAKNMVATVGCVIAIETLSYLIRKPQKDKP